MRLPQRGELVEDAGLDPDQTVAFGVGLGLEADGPKRQGGGVLSWVQRIKRVRERCADLLGDNGWRWRVLRTSNAYNFRDPGAADRPDLLSPKIQREPQIKSFPLFHPVIIRLQGETFRTGQRLSQAGKGRSSPSAAGCAGWTAR